MHGYRHLDRKRGITMTRSWTSERVTFDSWALSIVLLCQFWRMTYNKWIAPWIPSYSTYEKNINTLNNDSEECWALVKLILIDELLQIFVWQFGIIWYKRCSKKWAFFEESQIEGKWLKMFGSNSHVSCNCNPIISQNLVWSEFDF